MFDHPLSLPARLSVTVTTLVFVLVCFRALFRDTSPTARRLGAGLLTAAFLLSAAFAHIGPLTDTLAQSFPLGLVLALTVAIGSLFSAPARRAFDRLEDQDVRLLLSFRAIYGALLFALASLGHFPLTFALTAGLGDLAVTWVALTIPANLGREGPVWARLLVHGIGLVDLVMVLFLAATVVRPWSIAHGNATTTMTLPWVAVPLMFAVNAHGVRRAARELAEPVGDGSESSRGVRSALS
jgi:hypothetical protein